MWPELPVSTDDPANRAVEAELAADAAGNNQRPVVALPFEPATHEH